MAEAKKIKTKCTDEQLAVLAQSGNQAAQTELLERYAPLVRSRARYYYLVGGETEDLIQEGMMGLFCAISEYGQKDGALQFSGFADMCVTRRIIDAVKSSGRLKNLPLNNYVSIFDSGREFVEPSDIEAEVIREEERREFLQRISRILSDFEFRVIVMYVDGMTLREICEATGKDGKSIDNAVQRCKKKLEKIIKR